MANTVDSPTAVAHRRRALGSTVALVLLAAAATAVLHHGGSRGPAYPVVSLTPVDHEVRYEVDGPGAVPVISWIVGDDNKEQTALDVPLPWRQSVQIPVGPSGSHANIEVASPQSGQGSLSCRMFVDGVQVAQQTSTDGFTGVACSALIPATYVK